MNTHYHAFYAAVVTFIVFLCGNTTLRAEYPREQLFDDRWLFHLGNIEGAEATNFNDRHWRKLDLPHDWSIEDLLPREDSLLELEVVSGKWHSVICH